MRDSHPVFGEQFDFTGLGLQSLLGGVDVDGRNGPAGDDPDDEKNDDDLDEGETVFGKLFTSETQRSRSKEFFDSDTS